MFKKFRNFIKNINMLTTSQSFNIATIIENVPNGDFTIFATDKRNYVFDHPLTLVGYLGKTFKMRLLEMTFELKDLTYNNLVAGESSTRKIIGFQSTSDSFFLEGQTIKETFNPTQPIHAEFSFDSPTYNFGRGIIVDNFDMADIVSHILIESDPPTNNSIVSLNMIITIKYNNNY